ncbi:hypothetical protein FGG08_002795 [Glutinoglossum americanum]|uniref:Phosphotransferase n=1 Tax=Glutinoglossum americanum TaxID=1670608 RepID=A0A9P8L1A8_9PEZI|nr:hypothetical protein FGG08_002795 [Glutinoglossum americanum]
MLLKLPFLLHALFPKSTPPRQQQQQQLCDNVLLKHCQTMEDFVREVVRLFEAPLRPSALLAMSNQLLVQFRKRLQDCSTCMLPSYNYTLPIGNEKGTYLALDVGGSTLRVALVELCGRTSVGEPMCIKRMESWRIDGSIKALKGDAFFDWMAARIEEMLGQSKHVYEGNAPLPIGLAWSFPVEQTSIQSGTLLEMGKGFHAAHGVLGRDLGELVMEACRRRDLNVRMDAIVNDSSAALLSRAYLDASTRFALILGTGCNAAIHIPVTTLGPGKFGIRPSSWHEKATHVLVNTELSMFGKGIFPRTRWDELLNEKHLLPDFQPFEQLISGRYLGEIVRLILVEAIQTAGLFGGEVPEGFLEPYSLDTYTIGVIEADDTPTYTYGIHALLSHYSLTTTPTPTDLNHIRRIISLVSHRAAAYLAAAIHALWCLHLSAEHLTPPTAPRVSISCSGSVVEKYPGFQATTQSWLDALTEASGASARAVALEPAVDSTILGAAVAAGCLP